MPRKVSADKINCSKLNEPFFTEDDWKEFNRGIELFNSGKFWHAHEAWEQVWRRHHEGGRLFIQGLIQMAAAFHLLIEKKRYTGARSNFNKALRNFHPFEPTFLGLPVTTFIDAIERAKTAIDQIERGESEDGVHITPPVISRLQKKSLEE